MEAIVRSDRTQEPSLTGDIAEILSEDCPMVDILYKRMLNKNKLYRIVKPNEIFIAIRSMITQGHVKIHENYSKNESKHFVALTEAGFEHYFPGKILLMSKNGKERRRS